MGTKMIVLWCFVLAAASAVVGQVQVYPMRFSLNARPGDTISTALTVQNSSETSNLKVSIKATDLIQTESGRLDVIEPNLPGQHAGQFSCLGWIRLDKEYLDIPPQGSDSVGVEITVPDHAKGFRYGGLVVRHIPEGPSGAVLMDYRFVAPVFVQVGGRPTSREVRIGEIGLEQSEDGTAGAYLTVTNTGSAFCQVTGNLRVARVVGNRQQVIGPRLGLGQVGILPGSRLVLRTGLGRPLDKGIYKVSGSVSVDHRFTDHFDEDVQFIPAANLNLPALSEQIASLTIQPLEQPGHPMAQARIALTEDRRPMRLLLDQSQAGVQPVFVGRRVINLRANFQVDLTAQASGISDAGGAWIPSLGQVFGEPDQVRLELKGQQLDVRKLASSTGIVRLTVSIVPRP